MRLARWVAASGAALLATGAAMVVLAPTVSAAPIERTTRVGNSVEAWYTTTASGACGSPIGCPDVGAPTTYPADTLHVGLTGTQETARTYLEPNLAALPADAEIRSGVLRLPLADAESGTTAPELATAQACLVTKPYAEGAEGELTPPPAINCELKAPAALTPAKDTVVVDLTRFLAAWGSGTPNYGVALVAIPPAEPSQPWRLTFNGRSRPGVAPTGRIASDITYTVEGPATAPGGTPTTPAPFVPPTNSGGFLPPLSPGGLVTLPTVQPTQPPTSAAPTVAAPQPQTRPVGLIRTPWYSYRGVVFLPLILLVATGLLIRTLSGPVPPMTTRATS